MLENVHHLKVVYIAIVELNIPCPVQLINTIAILNCFLNPLIYCWRQKVRGRSFVLILARGYAATNCSRTEHSLFCFMVRYDCHVELSPQSTGLLLGTERNETVYFVFQMSSPAVAAVN